MLGAIAGDVIGSAYEANAVKTTHFPLFPPGACFTDDTVLTVATAEALLEHVVAQVHHEVVITQELAGDQHAVRQAERHILRDERDRGADAPRVVAGVARE